MNIECLPISTMPGTTALFRDYVDAGSSAHGPALRRWYPTDPFSMGWAKVSPELSEAHRGKLADALLRQADGFGASGEVFANI